MNPQICWEQVGCSGSASYIQTIRSASLSRIPLSFPFTTSWLSATTHSHTSYHLGYAEDDHYLHHLDDDDTSHRFPTYLLLWLSLLSVLPLAFSSDDRRSKLNQIFDSESSCQASPIGCFFSQSNWILILQDAPSIRLRDEQLVPFEAFAELRA